MTANNSLTHLPFELNHDREHASEAGVFEFPVTIEDEALPELGSRLPQALELAKKLARYGGSCVILIHPDTLGHKFEFERGFVAAVREWAWFGTVSEFGSWWSARNEVGLDIQSDKLKITASIEVPKRMAGLALDIPPDLVLQGAWPAGVKASQSGSRVLIGEAAGSLKLFFHKITGPMAPGSAHPSR